MPRVGLVARRSASARLSRRRKKPHLLPRLDKHVRSDRHFPGRHESLRRDVRRSVRVEIDDVRLPRHRRPQTSQISPCVPREPSLDEMRRLEQHQEQRPSNAHPSTTVPTTARVVNT